VPLLSLPPHEMLPRLFQKEMARRKILWRTARETSSQDLVSIHVRNGLGAGLAVQTPELQRDSGLNVPPLSGCPIYPFGQNTGELGENSRNGAKGSSLSITSVNHCMRFRPNRSRRSHRANAPPGTRRAPNLV
jgi:hypothetical protein